MFWWIVLVIILAPCAIFLVLVILHNPPAKGMDHYWNDGRPDEEVLAPIGDYGIFDDSVAVDAQRRADAISRAEDEFYSDYLRGKTPITCRVQGARAAVVLDAQELLVVEYIIGELGHDVKRNTITQVSDIIRTEAVQTKKTIYTPVSTLVPVSVTKQKSALGRAAVGALVAGPVGAVVGAVSAVPQTVRTEHKEVTTMEERHVEGDAILSIWTRTDPISPHKLFFNNMDEALALKYLIEAAGPSYPV